MNEADTCRNYILPSLNASGWEEDAILEQYVLTPGRIVPTGSQHTRKQGLRPDYVLFLRRNIPIAVVEAKAEYINAADGLAQAMRYAEMLGVQFAYASNGRKIIEHDFIGSLGIGVVNHFLDTDLTENTDFIPLFSAKSAQSVSKRF